MRIYYIYITIILILLKTYSGAELMSPNSKSQITYNEFLISIEITERDELALKCKSGCAWSSLKVTCPGGVCEKEIDQAGLADLSKNEYNESEKLETFQILINKKLNEFTLKCHEGCAWSELNFNMEGNNQNYSINQYGMTQVDD